MRYDGGYDANDPAHGGKLSRLLVIYWSIL